MTEKEGQIDESIQELDGVNAKKNPKKVVQLVNSLVSIINYGNKSDSGTKEKQTKVWNAFS